MITPREILSQLKSIYCGSIGFDFMHIPDRERCNWLRDRIETPSFSQPFGKDKALRVLERLTFSDHFEGFLAKKYVATKRFGLEGLESMVPGMKEMVDTATEQGVDHVVLGMPHRGRLSVLCNVIRKPMSLMFREFEGTHVDMDRVFSATLSGGIEDWTGSGDVKYHLGTTFDRTYPDGR